MSTRRNFFKFLSIGTAAAAGGAVTAATLIASSGKSDAVKKIEEAAFNGKMTLGAEYGELAPKKPMQFMEPGPDVVDYVAYGGSGGSGVYSPGPDYIPGTRKHVTASLTVGPDGEVYLMTNGKWRRIVTE
jgi:hypothetical protein